MVDPGGVEIFFSLNIPSGPLSPLLSPPYAPPLAPPLTSPSSLSRCPLSLIFSAWGLAHPPSCHYTNPRKNCSLPTCDHRIINYSFHTVMRIYLHHLQARLPPWTANQQWSSAQGSLSLLDECSSHASVRSTGLLVFCFACADCKSPSHLRVSSMRASSREGRKRWPMVSSVEAIADTVNSTLSNQPFCSKISQGARRLVYVVESGAKLSVRYVGSWNTKPQQK